MKNFAFCLLFIFSCYSCFSQTYKVLEDKEAFQKLYIEKAKNIVSLESKFVQEKSISFLEKKLISEGTFQFRKPSMLRMEYTKPFQYLFILNNDRVIIKSNSHETNISTNSNKVFKIISQITVDCVSGNVFNNKNFKSTILENNDSYLITLVPSATDIKSIMNEIKVIISKADYTVVKLEMVETSGDFTILVFKDKEINKTIPDASFTGK